jgi:Cdc6-like AAA superfamily ATPase
MLPEASPFTPGQPVPMEFFVGRIQEIERLRSLVRAAALGRFKIGFVMGERGMGKSSLVSFVRSLCEREDNVAGAHVYLGGATDLPDMIRRSFDRILKDSIDKSWAEKVRTFFGDHVRKIGLFGASVELNLKPEELSLLASDFIPSLRQLLQQLKGERKALFLIWDDINGLADSAEFANWLKSTVDQIATENKPFHVCILVVGVEERRRSLIALQPSLARVFDLTDIRPWSKQETTDFYAQTFQQAAALRLEKQALQEMVRYAGGLPVLAHEIGDAVWRAAEAGVVTEHDARVGIANAAIIAGRKFLEPQIEQALRSKRYRAILRKLAAQPFQFQRNELKQTLTAEEGKSLDNFLNRMKEIGALVSDPDAGAGHYQFAQRLYQLYFSLEAARTETRHE